MRFAIKPPVDAMRPLSDRLYSLGRMFRLLWTQTALRLIFGGIGRGAIVFKPGLIYGGDCIRVGARSVIRYGCRLEVVRHGQAWTPRLEIGRDVNIEQNVHIVCHDTIIIGDNVSITGHCAIVDVSHPFKIDSPKIGANIDAARSYVEIGEGTFVGFGSTILPNVRIGRMCLVGAGSVVTSDIPDYSIAAGVPAKVVGHTAPPA